MTDLRWLTAISDGILGLALIALAIRVWWMPLHRRAVVFEPYLKPRGVEWLMQSWPLVFVAGLFLIVSGASRFAYWHQGQSFASGIGLMEAIFSLWAAGSVAVVSVRAWRGG